MKQDTPTQPNGRVLSSPSESRSATATTLPPVAEWIESEEFSTTAEVAVPEKLIDQVIGQERAVEVIRKAAEQRRHVMLIGDPGTGKSMLARSMTEFLPKEGVGGVLPYARPEGQHNT